MDKIHPLLDTANRDNHLGPFCLALILSLAAAVVGSGLVAMLHRVL